MWSAVTLSVIPATPATLLVPNCISVTRSFGSIINVEGGPTTWAIVGSPYHRALACTLDRSLQRCLTAAAENATPELDS